MSTKNLKLNKKEESK